MAPKEKPSTSKDELWWACKASSLGHTCVMSFHDGTDPLYSQYPSVLAEASRTTYFHDKHIIWAINEWIDYLIKEELFNERQ